MCTCCEIMGCLHVPFVDLGLYVGEVSGVWDLAKILFSD